MAKTILQRDFQENLMVIRHKKQDDDRITVIWIKHEFNFYDIEIKLYDEIKFSVHNKVL